MKMRIVVALLALLPTPAFGADWSIRWEAAKGPSICSVPYEPRSLKAIRSTLPSGHPEADADIKNGCKPAASSAVTLGTYAGSRVIAVELEVPTSYYSRYFLIVAEVEVGTFMPIYIHQYAPGVHGHGKPFFQAGESGVTVIVTSMTYGTTPSEKMFRITSDLKSPPMTAQCEDDVDSVTER